MIWVFFFLLFFFFFFFNDTATTEIYTLSLHDALPIRGGYGIFYDRVFGNLFSNSSANPPFQRDVFNITVDFAENLDRPATQIPSPVVLDGAEIFPVIFALPGNNQFQSKYANP